jgi:hypothetical protein
MSLSVDVNIEGFDGKMKGTVMVEKYGAEYSTVTVDGRRTADGRVILTMTFPFIFVCKPFLILSLHKIEICTTRNNCDQLNGRPRTCFFVETNLIFRKS